MKIAIVAPHIFMQNTILDKVIFSPGQLAIDLADQLSALGHNVTLCTPGKVTTKAQNLVANLQPFHEELKLRGDTELDLLKKYPLTFISLARQVQAELLAEVYQRANMDEFDVVHVYMNEEELGLSFRKLCSKPLVFTHHDPYNFSAKYRSIMPLHQDANWLSMSLAQRAGMPSNTNWTANIYHGLPLNRFFPVQKPTNDYVLYLGRIIEPKGVHLAIAAVQHYNLTHTKSLKLKIAGKHYSGTKDSYWKTIEPLIEGKNIEYVGYVGSDKKKNALLGNAVVLIVPSLFDEPFGMVMIESLASGTPIVGLDSGAIPEVVSDNVGIVVNKVLNHDKVDSEQTAQKLAQALELIPKVDRQICRQEFEKRFTIERMAKDHAMAYRKLITDTTE